MVKGQVMREAAEMAGGRLADYFGKAYGLGGKVGKETTQSVLGALTNRFAPGVPQSELPKILRKGARGTLPQVGQFVGEGVVLASVLEAGRRMMNQQSNYSQPMQSAGDAATRQFLQQQALQQQKFQNDLALIYAQRENRTPGVQYSPEQIAEAERLMTEAGEITNREVLGVARSIYGTGLRA